MNLVSLLFSFEGRIGPQTCRRANTIVCVVGMVAFVFVWTLASPDSPFRYAGGLKYVLVPLLLACGCACWYAQAALTAKRVHDLDNPGRYAGAPWLFVVLAISIVVIFAAAGQFEIWPLFFVATVLYLVLIGWILWILWCLLWQIVRLNYFPGTPGDNNYGPPPGQNTEGFTGNPHAGAATVAGAAPSPKRRNEQAPRPAQTGFGRRTVRPA